MATNVSAVVELPSSMTLSVPSFSPRKPAVPASSDTDLAAAAHDDSNKDQLLRSGTVSKEDKAAQKANRKKVLHRMMKLAKPESGKIVLGLVALLVNAITNLSFPNIMRQAVDQAAIDVMVPETTSKLLDSLPRSLSVLAYFVVNNYFVTKAAGIFFVGSVASWLRVYYLGSAKERIVTALRKDLFESYMDKDKEFFDSCEKGDLVGKLAPFT
jgi:hypothetical protein